MTVDTAAKLLITIQQRLQVFTHEKNKCLSLSYPLSPPQARIKAINTFFGKNGFHSVDLSVYSPHAQPQAPYGSHVYMQQVYSPQQQYPVYPVVSPSWSPSLMPYFETPLVRMCLSHCVLQKLSSLFIFSGSV